MSEKSQSPRPSQVTVAGWVALVASLLMVLSLFEAVSVLQSVDLREAVDEFLSTPPGNGLGLDTAEYVDFMRRLMLFSGAAGAAAAVFAVFALMRHKGARVGLTVAAAMVFLTTAPFATPPLAEQLPVMTSAAVLPVAFAAVMLWTRPARDWFAGRPAARAGSGAGSRREPYAVPGPRQRLESRVLASQSHPPQEEPDGENTAPWPTMPEETSDRPLPPPTHGFGSPPGQAPQYPGQGGYPPQPPAPYGGQPTYGQPPYGQQPYGQVPYGAYPPQYGRPYLGDRPGDLDRRPATVTIAAFLTWVLSALALAGLIATAAALPSARDEILRQLQNTPEFQQSGLTIDEVIAAVRVMIAVAFFWAVVAIVLALFAYRRANWARITLAVSAVMTAFFTLVAAVQAPVLLLGAAAAVGAVVLLFSGGANQWYARRTTVQGFPGPFKPYGSPQYGPPQYGQSPPYDPGRPEEPAREEPPRERGKDEPPPNVW